MRAISRPSPDVRRVLERLAPLPEPSPRPALVVLVGLPGVGKSTFARRLAALPTGQAGLAPVAVVGSDDVRKILFPRPQYTDGEHARVFGVAYATMAELLRQGVSVVFDATNLRESARRKAYKIARDTDSHLVVVEVTAAPEVVRQRMEARDNGADPQDRSDATWEVYQAMAETAEPLRRRHYTVDTSGDTAEALKAVAAEMQRARVETG